MRDGVIVTLNHLSELLTVPFVYSMQAILIHLVLSLPCSVLESGISNMDFTVAPGLDCEFSPEKTYCLSIGANFALTPPAQDFDAFQAAVVDPFERRCHLAAFFHDKESQLKDVPAKFVIPSDFHPLDLPREPDPQDPDSWWYNPADTLTEYLASVRQHAAAAISAAKSPKRKYNLSKRHRDALRELAEDESIVIAACDKNLGICVDSSQSYDMHAREELARTHDHVTNDDYAALQETRDEIQRKLSHFWKGDSVNMFPWMADWCRTAFDTCADPKSGRKFQVPAFRLLYKIHKNPIEYRPLTMRFCYHSCYFLLCGERRHISRTLARLLLTWPCFRSG